MEFQATATHLILFTTVHSVVLWVTITFLRGTQCLHHLSFWIWGWQIPLKFWYPAITNLEGLLTQKTALTAVITHTHTHIYMCVCVCVCVCAYIYIYIYIQFLIIINRTSASILAYRVRWSTSDMCMVLFLCHNYVLHVSNNRIVLLLCHDCVLHRYQTVADWYCFCIMIMCCIYQPVVQWSCFCVMTMCCTCQRVV